MRTRHREKARERENARRKLKVSYKKGRAQNATIFRLYQSKARKNIIIDFISVIFLTHSRTLSSSITFARGPLKKRTKSIDYRIKSTHFQITLLDTDERTTAKARRMSESKAERGSMTIQIWHHHQKRQHRANERRKKERKKLLDYAYRSFVSDPNERRRRRKRSGRRTETK